MLKKEGQPAARQSQPASNSPFSEVRALRGERVGLARGRASRTNARSAQKGPSQTDKLWLIVNQKEASPKKGKAQKKEDVSPQKKGCHQPIKCHAVAFASNGMHSAKADLATQIYRLV